MPPPVPVRKYAQLSRPAAQLRLVLTGGHAASVPSILLISGLRRRDCSQSDAPVPDVPLQLAVEA
jgi:hypothetical protein